MDRRSFDQGCLIWDELEAGSLHVAEQWITREGEAPQKRNTCSSVFRGKGFFIDMFVPGVGTV